MGIRPFALECSGGVEILSNLIRIAIAVTVIPEIDSG
jgi:hypothetical protein